jgi:hypothetical protein
MPIQYQLVLQWDQAALDDDGIASIQTCLSEQLAEDHLADGYDFGGDTINLFIITCQPEAAFSAASRLITEAGLRPPARAGYRHFDVDETAAEVAARDESYWAYRPVWPKDLQVFSVI